jgi:hypothetical protein
MPVRKTHARPPSARSSTCGPCAHRTLGLLGLRLAHALTQLGLAFGQAMLDALELLFSHARHGLGWRCS